MYSFEKYLEKNIKNLVKALIIVSAIGLLYFVTAVYDQTSIPEMDALAQMTEVANSSDTLSAHIISEGNNNVYRKVIQKKFGEMIELATYEQGKLIYFIEVPYSEANQISYKLEYLSTQGTGMVSVSILDAEKKTLLGVSDVYTGNLSTNSPHNVFINKRYLTNYKGDWIEKNENIIEIFKKAGLNVKTVEKEAKFCRLEVIAGEGQHVLIKEFQMSNVMSQAVSVSVQAEGVPKFVGDNVVVKTFVKNIAGFDLHDINIKCILPEGYGLLQDKNSAQKVISLLPAGATTELVWTFKANRSDAVNFGKKWYVYWTVDGNGVAGADISITDNRAGKVYYVMTEDLEPIDGSGYNRAWGEQTGWITPEELKVQLVDKAEALNAIADKYGGKWTHYLAAPALEAGLWAESKSKTGAWKKTIDAVKKSVMREAARGHEYALHLHIDYDPYVKKNVLSYNKNIDGLWANHLQHGWAHSLSDFGSIDRHETRLGSLFYYQKMIDSLSKDSPQGEILSARVGSFDIGFNEEEMEKSIKAYKVVGLLGSTDADGNIEGRAARNYGNELYFTKKNNINLRASSPDDIGLVEFCPTPFENIEYDSDNAAKMNEKAKEAFRIFAPHGSISAGVHAIVGFTHAMFVSGNSDWKSTVGGQFDEIDKHLKFLQENYVNNGNLIFATGTELIKAYLDYYTPKVIAVYGKKIDDGYFSCEYEIELLGKDIPIDNVNVHTVAVKYPLYLTDEIFFVEIKKNDKVILKTSNVPNDNNEIIFTIDDKTAKYKMKIYTSKYAQGYLKIWKR